MEAARDQVHSTINHTFILVVVVIARLLLGQKQSTSPTVMIRDGRRTDT